MNNKNFLVGVLLLLSLMAPQSHAAGSSSISVLGGQSSDASLLGVSWRPDSLLLLRSSLTAGTEITGAIEMSLSGLEGDERGGRDGIIVGATPVFSIQAKNQPSLSFEIGIGANYFTEKRVHQGKTMGTHFQFGDLVGVEWKFGSGSRYSVGYRFIHYSNASISTLNPGLDFHLLRFTGSF